jgi:hypothetical protein
VQQRVGHCEIGAGGGLQVPGRLAGGGGGPWVDHDLGTAALALPGQVTAERGHRLRDVRADQQQRVRGADVGQRERQPAVHPERPVARRGRGGHAEPAVVVDVPGAQHDPGELAQRVRLLVGQPAAAEHGDGVPSVPRLGPGDLGDHDGERLFPGGRAQPTALAVAQQRRGQPVRVVEQLGRGPALLA